MSDACFFRRLYFFVVEYLMLGKQSFLQKEEEDLICLSEVKRAWANYGHAGSSSAAAAAR